MEMRFSIWRIWIAIGFTFCCLLMGSFAYFRNTSSSHQPGTENAHRPIANVEKVVLKLDRIVVAPNTTKPSLVKSSTTKIEIQFKQISGKSPRGSGTVKLMQRGDDGIEVVQSTTFKFSRKSDKSMIVSFDLKVPKHAKNGDALLRVRDLDVNLFEFPVLIVDTK